MLVGRDRQVRELQDYVTGLARGRGVLVLIGGEPGIGKTRLAEEAVALAERAGVETRRVTCWAQAGAPPFWPWSRLVDGTAANLFDVAADDSDPELARFQRFSAFADWLRDAARHRPLLLVFDDLQWADEPSMHLLAFVAPLLTDTPVAIVATYRDTELGDGCLGAVLPELVRHGQRVAVSPLTRDEMTTFASGVVGVTLPDPVAGRVHALTAGNPLFARELLHLLEMQGALTDANVEELPVPDSVRATLSRRLDMCSPSCHDVLAVASVIGVDFDTDVVAEATGLDPAPLLEALDEAVGLRLVRAVASGHLAFTHPLIRETAYRDLGLARRVRVHQDVAEALEHLAERGADVDLAALAHHFRNASAGGNAEKAVAYAAAAGTRAMAMSAYEAAVANFETALETLALVPADDARRADLLLDLGDARVAAGDLKGARPVYEEVVALARANHWPRRLGRAALGYGAGPGGFEVATADEPQIHVLREAIAAADDEDLHLRSRLLARLSVALSLTGTDAERAALSAAAIALARAAADPADLGYALAAHCDTIAGPEHSEERRAAATEIIGISHARRDLRMELLGRRLRLLALCEMGEFAEVDIEIDAYERAASALRQPLYTWYVPLWRGMRALMEGRFEDAFRLCAEAEAIGVASGSENAKMLTMTLRMNWYHQTGFGDPMYRETNEILREYSGMWTMVRPLFVIGGALAGRVDEARLVLDEMATEDYAPESLGAEWLPSLCFIAEAIWRVGGHPLGPEIYQRVLPYRHRVAVDGIGGAVLGSVEVSLGMLAASMGRLDEAREHVAAGLATHRRWRASFLADRTQAIADSIGVQAVAATDDSFLREGDVWAVTFGGRTTRVRHAKGMTDIARLLEQPGREIHALDLVADGPVVATGDAGPRLDDQARDTYKRRLIELEAELEAADETADAGRSEVLVAERDALLAELSGAYGLGGRARRTAAPAERARSTVTQRIRDAVNRIAAQDPELGRHLRQCVRTGTFCAYVPDRDRVWSVRLTT